MKATADCWKETKSPGKIDAEIHLAPPQHKINKSMGILPPSLQGKLMQKITKETTSLYQKLSTSWSILVEPYGFNTTFLTYSISKSKPSPQSKAIRAFLSKLYLCSCQSHIVTKHSMILQILPGFCRCYQTTFFLGWINREILHGKEQFWCSQFKDASSLVAVVWILVQWNPYFLQ